MAHRITQMNALSQELFYKSMNLIFCSAIVVIFSEKARGGERLRVNRWKHYNPLCY
jgi:hypothetical protein